MYKHKYKKCDHASCLYFFSAIGLIWVLGIMILYLDKFFKHLQSQFSQQSFLQQGMQCTKTT